jgi:hypothetical protein
MDEIIALILSSSNMALFSPNTGFTPTSMNGLVLGYHRIICQRYIPRK